jgi:hypothetical protein
MNRFQTLALAMTMTGFAVSAQAAVTDSSPHKIRFVTVQQGVKLEVLDFGGGSGGGSGPPLIFLPGLGSTAHDFDRFAPSSPANITFMASRGAAPALPTIPGRPSPIMRPTGWAMM